MTSKIIFETEKNRYEVQLTSESKDSRLGIKVERRRKLKNGSSVFEGTKNEYWGNRFEIDKEGTFHLFDGSQPVMTTGKILRTLD